MSFKRKYKIVWLKPIGFNNAYAVMMRRKQAAELKIQTISQLKMFIDHN
jgi:osmoprotectant transport system permease protein